MEHLEGRHSVLAALHACQRRIQLILLRQGMHPENTQDILDLAAQRGVPVKHVARRELDALAHGLTHGGVIALCGPKPRTTPAQLLHLLSRLREPPLLLLLEGVDDARNLGFTLRTAEALGAHALLIKKHLWDFDPVEVARPASGAYERMPLVQLDDLRLIDQLQKQDIALIGCKAGAKKTIHQTDLTAPVILAIGGEKRGLSGALRSKCDAFMTIPTSPPLAKGGLGGVVFSPPLTKGGFVGVVFSPPLTKGGQGGVASPRAGPGGVASSLPLSHAAAIVLAEALRQRTP